MKKRILCFLTTLLMLTALLSTNMITVSAYNGTKYNDYLYYKVKNNGEVTITDCDESVTEIVIPAEIDGKKVTSIGGYAFFGCSNLTSVKIPNNVTSIVNCAFYDCDNLSTIFYPGSQENWENIYIGSSNGSLNNATKVYNATKKTYKFETNCDKTLEDITDYAVMVSPKLENKGKTLVGWYDNKGLTGNPVTFPYYGNATTLYASWTDRTVASFDDAFLTEANQEYNANFSESGQMIYYEFVPRITGEYRFYSKGNLDTYGYLYNSNKYQLTSNDNGGEGNNFKITYNLTAGETYYIAVKPYSGTGTAVLVTETDCIEGTKIVCVTTNTGEKIFITIPSYLPENTSVILSCYEGNALSDVKIATNKNETIYFVVKEAFDSAKVMVWDSLGSMKPICESELVK